MSKSLPAHSWPMHLVHCTTDALYFSDQGEIASALENGFPTALPILMPGYYQKGYESAPMRRTKIWLGFPDCNHVRVYLDAPHPESLVAVVNNNINEVPFLVDYQEEERILWPWLYNMYLSPTVINEYEGEDVVVHYFIADSKRELSGIVLRVNSIFDLVRKRWEAMEVYHIHLEKDDHWPHRWLRHPQTQSMGRFTGYFDDKKTQFQWVPEGGLIKIRC